MSVGERLDADLGDPVTDKRIPNGITRCQSMVNEDQHLRNWTKIRETSCIPGGNSWSQWVEQSAREVVITFASDGRAARSRNLTETGLAYKRLSGRGAGRSIAYW